MYIFIFTSLFKYVCLFMLFIYRLLSLAQTVKLISSICHVMQNTVFHIDANSLERTVPVSEINSEGTEGYYGNGSL